MHLRLIFPRNPGQELAPSLAHQGVRSPGCYGVFGPVPSTVLDKRLSKQQ